MKEYYYICYFIFHFCEVRLILSIFGTGQKLRWNGMGGTIAKYVFIGSVALLPVINVTMMENVFSNGLMSIEIFLTAIGGKIFYKGKRTAYVTMSALFFMGIVLLELSVQSLIYTLLRNTGISERIFLIKGSVRGTYLLAASIIILYIQGAGRVKWEMLVSFIYKYRKRLRILIPVLFLLIAYYQWIYSIEYIEKVPMGNWLLLILGIYLVIFVMAVYSMREKEKISQIKYQAVLESYQKSQEQYKQKAELLHDEKNHLLIIREMAQKDNRSDIREYIDQLLKKIGESGKQIETGHEFLNLVLNTKIYEAERKEIPVTISFDDMRGLLLTETELTSIFCNVLDNAVEANIRMENRNHWIQVKGKRIGQAFVLNVSNPFQGELVQKETRLLTAKKDKEVHGHGMDSVKRIVDKYQGEVQYRTENEVFYLNIYLMGFK